MDPIHLTFDLKKLMRDNLVWSIILSIFLISLNLWIQPVPYDWSIWFVIQHGLFFIAFYSVLIVSHEIFHLIGFIVFGKVPFRSLSYGLKLEDGIAYATTTEKMSNRAMKASLLLPFWITGIIPTVLGFYLNSNMLILAGAFLMAGAVGDFTMYKSLRKYPNHYLIMDDPDQPKLTVYPNKKTTF